MTIRNRAAQLFLLLHILFTAITFGGSVYETMVINTVWSSALPESLSFMTNEQYSVQPGRFWRGMGPFPLIALVGAVIANWHLAKRRKLILISLACVAVNTVTTIFYFVPILKVIFAPDGGGRSGAELASLANNWMTGTWGRMALLLVSLVVSIYAMAVPAPKMDTAARHEAPTANPT